VLFYLDRLLSRAAALKPHRHVGSVAGIVRQLFGDSLRNAFHV
jgi:hypothetical protein